MAGYLFCLRCCRLNAAGLNRGNASLRETPTVKLDTTQIGSDVVVVKSGCRICGTGAAFSNSPLVQNKSYFEVKLQSTGTWGLGVATQRCGVNAVPLGQDSESWVLRHDGGLAHDGEVKSTLPQVPEEGDIIGVSYDHVEMNFFLNGKPLNTPFLGIKGTVFPIFYVDDGATLDVQFKRFYHEPPGGFEEIMIEKSLL